MLTYVLIGIIALLAVALLAVALLIAVVLLRRLFKWRPPPGPGT